MTRDRDGSVHVLANRCSQLAGKPVGSKDPVHPNDHVNMGQSSNDIIPTAIHVAVGERLRKFVLPALEQLHSAFEKKAVEFWDVIKSLPEFKPEWEQYSTDSLLCLRTSDPSNFAAHLDLPLGRLR